MCLQAGGSGFAARAAWSTIQLLLETPFQRSDCCAAMHMGRNHAAAACQQTQLHTHALWAAVTIERYTGIPQVFRNL